MPASPKNLKCCIGQGESLLQDPIYGYIPFTSPLEGDPPGSEITERDLIDHPFVQRQRRIHQLQTAWLVYPTAEHTRFTHALGAMHTASIAWAQLKTSFRCACQELPSEEQPPSDNCIEALLRVAGLLHDVGHGPFGHFFDQHFLSRFKDPDGEKLTHERLGAVIIKERLASTIRRLRRTPNGVLRDDEAVDPEQVAFLIVRPKEEEHSEHPRWLYLLRTLFSGLYTVDNMDFVLRDAWLSGLSPRAFDRDRLLRYSFFTPRGLAIHSNGLSTLTQFLTIRAELFRSVYFHRTVRAADIQLARLFEKSSELIFPFGDPRQHLDEYLRLTEWSLLEDVSGWGDSDDDRKQALACEWADFLGRKIRWRRIAERTVNYRQGERGSIFNDLKLFKGLVCSDLQDQGIDSPFDVDIVRHTSRPNDYRPTGSGNFLYDAEKGTEKPLAEEDIYRDIPRYFRICRIYAPDDTSTEVKEAIRKVFCHLVDNHDTDDPTNM